MSTPNTFEFKTETKKLLDLMIHSVYSHKEIFLRELISNASDALDKLRFEALTHDQLREQTQDLHIRLDPDPGRKVLAIHDNGIGMTRDEVIQYIGTIAKSGTTEWAKMLKDGKAAPTGADGKEQPFSPELIGQFGVGFYSCFMVAKEVWLVTRKAGETGSVEWRSTGDGTYTITETTRETPGTSIYLSLKDAPKDGEEGEGEEFQDFTAEWTLRELVKKYSDFVAYPIKMRTSRTQIERGPDGKAKEGGKEETVVEDVTLNSMKAIWTRPEKDVTPEEYKEFYKHISHDWNEPLHWITYRAEGTTSEFRALVYLPTKAGPGLMLHDTHKGVHLYIKRVFIMSDCKELIPEYLRFVRGVIDSEDLSLNISREILQQNKQILAIKRSVTKKVLDTLKKMRADDKEKFRTFWSEFGSLLKEGLFKNPEDKDKLLEVCVFDSTASKDEKTTLEEYVGRMKPDQKEIYFLTGESRSAVEASPHLERLRDRGYEVLLLSDPVDEVWVQFCWDFQGKRLKSIGKGDVELGTEDERKKIEEEKKQKETEYKSLFDCLKGSLEEHVKEVRLSTRLTSSPACLVGDQGDMSPHLEQLLKASGQDVPKTKRILEVNAEHTIVKKLRGIFEKDKADARLKDYAELLFGQAVLAEGGKLPDPAAFSRKMADLMMKALEG